MSVQCKNCEWCYKSEGVCSLVYHTRFKRTKSEKVNIKKQRVCQQFTKRKVG